MPTHQVSLSQKQTRHVYYKQQLHVSARLSDLSRWSWRSKLNEMEITRNYCWPYFMHVVTSDMRLPVRLCSDSENIDRNGKECSDQRAVCLSGFGDVLQPFTCMLFRSAAKHKN